MPWSQLFLSNRRTDASVMSSLLSATDLPTNLRVVSVTVQSTDGSVFNT